MQDRINDLIESGQLPTARKDALSQLIEETGQYVSQEGTQWDFKREWPFSHSDDYFGAIVRLICAFSNSFGGLIIFGVHDEKRTAGHNKVTPNLDRFLQALNNLLTDEPTITLRRYDQGTPDAVDALLVRPISTSSPPLRFKSRIGNYSEGTIWVRQHHEVLAA
jgi:predicted HTH transcriptional regulator